MTLLSPGLAAIPVMVAVAVATTRGLAAIAHEARLMFTVWLALRGTRPDERAEIIKACMLDAAPTTENNRTTKQANKPVELK